MGFSTTEMPLMISARIYCLICPGKLNLIWEKLGNFGTSKTWKLCLCVLSGCCALHIIISPCFRASVLDHRCRPNSVVTFKGTELTVRSTAEKKDKLDQVETAEMSLFLFFFYDFLLFSVFNLK